MADLFRHYNGGMRIPDRESANWRTGAVAQQRNEKKGRDKAGSRPEFAGSNGNKAPDNGAVPGQPETKDGDNNIPGFGNMLPGVMNMGAGVANSSSLTMALNYMGDDLDTYSGIWESAKFKGDEDDYARVVEALKHVCEGDNITDYIDTDNLLKYFAIQTFIYNHDGLTGTVTHNYYLYEQNGELNMIPWDMNEAFTVSGNGSEYVNFPIDTPFTVTDLSERSFFMSLLENEEFSTDMRMIWCFAAYSQYTVVFALKLSVSA